MPPINLENRKFDSRSVLKFETKCIRNGTATILFHYFHYSPKTINIIKDETCFLHLLLAAGPITSKSVFAFPQLLTFPHFSHLFTFRAAEDFHVEARLQIFTKLLLYRKSIAYEQMFGFKRVSSRDGQRQSCELISRCVSWWLMSLQPPGFCPDKLKS